MSARDDDGMSLVELLVGMFIATLFLGMLAMLFVNGLTAQQQATARDRATGQANVVSASLTSSIRNAVSTKVAADGLRVDATVLTASGAWQCRAWSLTSGAVRYSAGATARVADASAWKALATGATGTLASGKAFQYTGDRGVAVGIRVTDGAASAVISSGATAQAVAPGGAPACW